MATPKDLVDAVASILCVPTATVVVHDRNLATADPSLRKVGGRGRAAAKMDASDAAALTIAVAASENVKDSVRTVQLYGAMGARDPLPIGIAQYDNLSKNHSFNDALTALIQAAAARELENVEKLDLKFSFYMPTPRIHFEWSITGRSSETFYEPTSRQFKQLRGLYPVGDLERVSSITESTVKYLGDVIADRVAASPE